MIPIRVGFVGAGHIANVHASILAGDPRVRLSGVFDPDKSVAEAFAQKHTATTMPSLNALLDVVHAVYVCSPNALHAATSRRALRSGVHVFCEKPMATSLPDAHQVLAAAMSEDAVYQAGFNRRFAPVYTNIKERISSGKLVPMSGLCKINRGELRKPRWISDPSITGGFLYETPIHILDIARLLFGEPSTVSCQARMAVYDQPDDFSMLLNFNSGMSLTLTANAHSTWLFPFERVEIYGDHAMIATEEMERLTFAPGLDKPTEALDFAHVPFESRWGYVEEDRRFIDAVVGDAPPAISAADAFKTVELVERCYAAARAH
jgi:myo-inositol 2-dehydrogenase/D-chiro-inositol 1-dehydrogenase